MFATTQSITPDMVASHEMSGHAARSASGAARDAGCTNGDSRHRTVPRRRPANNNDAAARPEARRRPDRRLGPDGTRQASIRDERSDSASLIRSVMILMYSS